MDVSLSTVIVEDEALISEWLRENLEDMGHSVVAVIDNGLEAVELCKIFDPDCILMDINIPKLDGISALNEINKYSEAPCIFITGYSDRDTIEKATNAGAYAYLTKPVNAADLCAALKIAVSRYNHDLSRRQEIAIAKQRLMDRKIIEQAKGIVSDLFRLSESNAMAYLQKTSRANNAKLIDTAHFIIKNKDNLVF